MIRTFWERLHQLENRHQVMALALSSFALVLFWAAADRLLAQILHLEESALTCGLAMAIAAVILMWLHRWIA